MVLLYFQNRYTNLNLDKKNFQYVSSGKSGISLIFNYLKDIKKINPKIDEAIVPKLMGHWVYSQLSQGIFTSPKITKYTKIVYLYHQFGIPQKINKKELKNLKKKYLIIEDCAHILSGKSNKMKIGNLGHFAIYSFSKFFSCDFLGGVYSNERSLINYIKEKKKTTNVNTFYLIKFFFRLINIFKKNKYLNSIIISLAYSMYNFTFKPDKKSIIKVENLISGEIEKRIDRLKKTRKAFQKFNFLDYDKSNDLYAPFAIPLVMNEKIIKRINEHLLKKNYRFEIIKFDINRNIFNPDYKKAILLDLGCIESIFELQISSILHCIEK